MLSKVGLKDRLGICFIGEVVGSVEKWFALNRSGFVRARDFAKMRRRWL